jgi:hypothetical protein
MIVILSVTSTSTWAFGSHQGLMPTSNVPGGCNGVYMFYNGGVLLGKLMDDLGK